MTADRNRQSDRKSESLPRSEISAGRKSLLQGAVRLLPSSEEVGKAIRTARTDEVWHPLFVEALEKKSYIEYLLDILLYDTPEEKKALVAEQRKEVMKLEQRIAGHTAEHDCGRSQRKSGLDR